MCRFVNIILASVLFSPIVNAADFKNVAFEKSAIVDIGGYYTMPLISATDGRDDTMALQIQPNTTYGISIDLGSEVDVEGIRLKFKNNSQSTYSYNVLGSYSASDARTLISFNNSDNMPVSEKMFAPVSFRWIYIDLTLASNQIFMLLDEIEVLSKVGDYTIEIRPESDFYGHHAHHYRNGKLVSQRHMRQPQLNSNCQMINDYFDIQDCYYGFDLSQVPSNANIKAVHLTFNGNGITRHVYSMPNLLNNNRLPNVFRSLHSSTFDLATLGLGWNTRYATSLLVPVNNYPSPGVNYSAKTTVFSSDGLLDIQAAHQTNSIFKIALRNEEYNSVSNIRDAVSMRLVVDYTIQ